jgi:sulfide dehydrogenase cytochrome subunit
MRAALALSVVILSLGAARAETEPPPGAASCSGCHSTAPAAVGGMVSLLGREPQEIVEAMRAYRVGERPATVMDRLAKGFSEAETRAIAEWIAAQPPGRSP